MKKLILLLIALVANTAILAKDQKTTDTLAQKVGDSWQIVVQEKTVLKQFKNIPPEFTAENVLELKKTGKTGVCVDTLIASLFPVIKFSGLYNYYVLENGGIYKKETVRGEINTPRKLLLLFTYSYYASIVCIQIMIVYLLFNTTIKKFCMVLGIYMTSSALVFLLHNSLDGWFFTIGALIAIGSVVFAGVQLDYKKTYNHNKELLFVLSFFALFLLSSAFCLHTPTIAVNFTNPKFQWLLFIAGNIIVLTLGKFVVSFVKKQKQHLKEAPNLEVL